MFVKVHKPLQLSGGNNKGSSSMLMDYLDKENEGKEDAEKGYFFNNEKDKIDKIEAKNIIDSNNKRLSEKDTKFYMFTINPSQREVEHLKKQVVSDLDPRGKKGIQFNPNDSLHKQLLEEKMKSYTKDVMDLYAKNFEREDGNGNPINLNSNDLNYVAKVEHSRTWDYKDAVLKHNRQINDKIKPLKKQLDNAQGIDKELINHSIKKLQGDLYKQDLNGKVGKDIDGDVIKSDMPKTGSQTHVHVVVSRQTKTMWNKGERIKDRDGNLIHPDYDKNDNEVKNARPMKLSPDAKTKGKSDNLRLNGRKVNSGFDHERFKIKCREKFEDKFNYKSNEKETYKAKSTTENVSNKTTEKIQSIGKGKLKQTLKEQLQGDNFKTEEKVLKTMKNPKKVITSLVKEKINEIKQASLKDIAKGI